MKNIFTAMMSTLLLAVSTGAQAVPLSDLLNGREITVGDKLFADWDILGLEGQSIDYSLIEVTGTNDPKKGLGLIFSDVTENGCQLCVDEEEDELYFSFGFSVTVTDPNWRITGNYLSLIDFDIEEYGYIDIVERVYAYDPLTNEIGDILCVNQYSCKEVYAYYGEGEGESTEDVFTFAAQESIWVEKFIYLSSWGERVQVVSFGQNFSQTSVPEPATVLLFGLGLSGIYWFGRRRVKEGQLAA